MKNKFLLRNSRILAIACAFFAFAGSYLTPVTSFAQIPTPPEATLYSDADMTIEKRIFERGDIVYAKTTGLSNTSYYQYGVYRPAPRLNMQPLNCSQPTLGVLTDMYDSSPTDRLSYGVTTCPEIPGLPFSTTYINGSWQYRLRNFGAVSGCTTTNTQSNALFRLAEAYAFRTAAARNTAAMDACESTGDCASALPRLYFCPGDESFLRIRGFFPCRTNVAYSLIKPDGTVLPAVPTTTDASGNLSVNYLIPNDATAGNIGLWQIRIGLTDGGTFISRYTVDLDLFNVRGNTIFAHKFYDANLNGTKEASEPWLEGWKMTLSGDATGIEYTSASGWATFDNLGDGDFTVTEGMLPNWIPTRPTYVDMTFNTESCGAHREPIFANVCIGGGTDAKSKGFWGNKNGKALITSGDLAILASNDLCLRNQDGTHFNPTSVTQLDNWLQKANSKNAAYMLSAQLAAMVLNYLHGFIDNADLATMIYAPGTTSANALGFATLADVLIEANMLLCGNGLILDGNSLKPLATALSNALDKANNNLNYLQATPCEVEFPINGTVRVAANKANTIEGISLATYPNPLTDRTTISYTLAEAANVSLIVYDGFGRQVAVLHNGEKAAGQHNTEWNAGNLAAGIYFCRLAVNSPTGPQHLQTTKMLLIK